MPSRLKRVAYNDEPVWVFGKPHRRSSGSSVRQSRALTCFGWKHSQVREDPDYSYQLRIAPGALPQDRVAAPSGLGGARRGRDDLIRGPAESTRPSRWKA